MAEEKKIVLNIETITDQAVMEAYGKTLNDVLGSYEDNVALISQYNAQIKANNEQIKAITAAAEAYGKTTKSQSEALARLTAENGKLTAAKAQLVQVTKNQEKINTTVKGTMENQAQLLGKLRMAWRGMTEEQKAANQGMLKTIQALDDGLKQSDASIGNFQRNVGNYAGAIRPLQTQVQMLVREMPTLTMSMNTFIMAISNNLPMFADEVKRLKNANVELAQQGKPTISVMGAIASSLFSWQTALVATITLMPRAITAITEWATNLDDVKARVDNVVNSVNTFKGVLNILEGRANRENAVLRAQGMDELDILRKEAFDAIQARNDARALLELVSKQKNDYAAKINKSWIVTDAEENELNRLNNAVADAEKTYLELEEKALNAKNKIDVKKAELATAQKEREDQLLTEIADEIFYYKLGEEEAELHRLESKYLREKALIEKHGYDTAILTKKYEEEKAAIRKKYREEEQRKVEEEQRKVEEEQRKVEEEQRKVERKRQQDLDKIADIEREAVYSQLSERDRALRELYDDFAKKKNLYDKYGKDTTNLVAQYEREKTDIIKRSADEARQAMEDSMSQQIDEAMQFFADMLADIEEEIANDPALKRQTVSAFARAIGVTDEELTTIKAQAQKAAQDIFNSIAKISQDATQRRLDDELDAIEREADSEKAILEGKLEKGLISQKEYEKKLAALDEETAARKEEANKEAFEKNKAWNIGQAIMNMALAITNIWATNKGGMAARIAETVIATASGLAQIATIASQKYARGGMLSGPSHAQGGIPGFVGNRHIEAEGGEAIINKRSTAKHRKLLSLINSDNGWGVDFANARGSSGRMFARGGVLGYDFSTAPLPDTRGSLAAFAQQQTANINNALSAINKRIDNIRVYLPLNDIENRTNEKRVNVSRANL